MHTKTWPFGVLAVAGISCAKPAPVDTVDVPGRYVVQVVNAAAAVDTIEIDGDGAFHHRLRAPGGQGDIDESGTWKLSAYPDGDPAVEFRGITPLADRSPPFRSAPGFWLARVEKTRDGAVRLMVNSDIGLAYTRVARLTGH